MKIILETGRLILREFRIEDAFPFYEMNLDEDVMRYTGDNKFNSVEKAEEFIRNYNHYKKYGYGRWTIVERNSGNYIGWCGLKFSEELEEIDIGFRIVKKYWNNGFAAEAARAVLDYGFNELKIENIVARALKDNIISIKLINKLGMKFIRSFKDIYGEWFVYEISSSRNNKPI